MKKDNKFLNILGIFFWDGKYDIFLVKIRLLIFLLSFLTFVCFLFGVMPTLMKYTSIITFIFFIFLVIMHVHTRSKIKKIF